MRPKSLILLVVAVGCGLLVMLGFNKMGDSKQEMVRVLVANVDSIPSHEPLKDEQVAFVEVPQNQLLWDAITRKEDYQGKALSVTVTKGEMITKAKLTDKFNASTEIDPGKLVVTVKVDLSTSHAGQIRPGDIVDIYTTYTMGQFGGNTGVQTKNKRVLSKIKVFSIDSLRSSNTPGNDELLAKTVSLLVDPDQASVLMMAEKKGAIQLALRNKLDQSEQTIGILTDDEFDKLESDDVSLRSDTPEDVLLANIQDNPEFQKLKEANENMQKELALYEKERQRAELEKKRQELKEAEQPKWTITIYDGSRKAPFEFLEEKDGESEGKLPEAPEGDAPSTEDLPKGDSTTSLEGDQPMNTALEAASNDN